MCNLAAAKKEVDDLQHQLSFCDRNERFELKQKLAEKKNILRQTERQVEVVASCLMAALNIKSAINELKGVQKIYPTNDMDKCIDMLEQQQDRIQAEVTRHGY